MRTSGVATIAGSCQGQLEAGARWRSNGLRRGSLRLSGGRVGGGGGRECGVRGVQLVGGVMNGRAGGVFAAEAGVAGRAGHDELVVRVEGMGVVEVAADGGVVLEAG